MSGLWEKLNLRDHREIFVLNAPKSFEAALKTLRGVRVQRRVEALKEPAFALAFVVKQTDLDRLSAAIAAKATGDALLWFAYPKGTSKRYSCDFNRDKGWDVLRAAGFDCVRQVAIDEDWSALRFRRTEFINHRSR
ncbi:MAG TPA: hypothetical protein VKG63_12785 [Steroidobacteraceae bacterium]|nr:hypothetical protein [Steroidobacteraceae bacterium]